MKGKFKGLKKVPKRWVVLDQGFIYMGMQGKDSENVSQKMGGPWSLLVWTPSKSDCHGGFWPVSCHHQHGLKSALSMYELSGVMKKVYGRKFFLSVNHCRTICVPVEMGFMWPAVYHVAVFYHRSYCLDIIWSVPEQSRVAVVVCCCWLFLYSAVIHSQANLLCSCRIWF